jgi:hypothetical protein
MSATARSSPSSGPCSGPSGREGRGAWRQCLPNPSLLLAQYGFRRVSSPGGLVTSSLMVDPGAGEKLKVFISYSRKDSTAFVDDWFWGWKIAASRQFLTVMILNRASPGRHGSADSSSSRTPLCSWSHRRR